MRSFKSSLGVISLSVVMVGGFQVGHIMAGGPHAGLHDKINQVLTATTGVSNAIAAQLTEASPDTPPADVFESVLDHVQREFVEGTDSDARLTNGALGRMFASLDNSKTDYLDQTLCRARQDALEGRYHGIGAVLTVTRTKQEDVDYHHLTVVDVMPGSPAEKAGLQTGDQITTIDGHWIIAYSVTVDYDKIIKEKTDDSSKKVEADKVNAKFQKGVTVARALPLLIGGEGKLLHLTVERGGQAAPMNLDVTTALTNVDPVEYRVLSKNIAYLRIRQFNGRASEAFDSALDKLEPGLKGLVIDLRGNPGGVQAEPRSALDGFGSALKLISRFTHAGNMAMIERKPNQRGPLTIPQSAGAAITLPLEVLVDPGSANLAELVTASLRDGSKAKVIGGHTFGDGVLQLFAVLKGGAGVEIDSGRLLTAAGGDLNKGIEPTIPVASSVRSAQDLALQRALSEFGV